MKNEKASFALRSFLRAGALAATSVAFGLAPTPALGSQGQQTEPQVQQTGTTPNGRAPIFLPVPATSPSTPGCTPTTSLLHFDGGYEVSMCYRTPDGVAGQAKAGLYASAESGLLWFFSRENAEVLVKVLNGCDINGHRWIFVAPVTTLEFDLWVTSPTGARWNHGNRQGVTAATRSDVAAFPCADEPEAAQDPMAPPSLLPTLAAAAQIETTSDTSGNGTSGNDTPVFMLATSPPHPGCTPTTGLLRFDGGYEVSMCYRTPDGVDGQAKAGIYSSAESGLLWFFSRENAEVLVKVLNGCAINGYRWVFVAPVTTLEFDLRVTSPIGARWNHTNTQGETAPTKSDVAAFPCADEPEAAPDLIVSSFSVSDATPGAGQNIALRATVRNRGDASASPTTIRFYRSSDSKIGTPDFQLGADAVAGLAPSATESLTFDYTVPSAGGTFDVFACVDSVSEEFDTSNNCSDRVRVVVRGPPPADLIVSSFSVSDENPDSDEQITLSATVLNQGDGPASPTTIRYHFGIAFSGSEPVAALSSRATESLTFDYTVPSAGGTFDVFACVDSVSEEFDTSNNCSDSVLVVTAETAPDLIVSDVSVSDANAVTDEKLEFTATVRNQGGGPAWPTTLRLYRSDDSTINASDLFVASAPLPALAASATEPWSLGFGHSGPVTYYFGACIDAVFGESDTDNNCSDGVLVTAAEPVPAPDLIVSRIDSSNDRPAPEEHFSTHVTVQNRGDAPASATTIQFYRSDDSTISTSDVELGQSHDLPALAASATASRTHVGHSGCPETYYLGACINPVLAESDTDNNCSEGVLVTVE